MRLGWKVVIGLSAALVLSTVVFAQRTTGGLTGTVKDDTGAVLPGVTVALTGQYVMGTQTSVTNDNGVYRFLNLAPGSYNLVFEFAGFATLNRNGLVVSVGMTTETNVTLSLSNVSESVTVTGASPVVDTIASDVSTNYDSEWVDNAPVTRNSFHDFIASAPGVVSPSLDSTNRGIAMVYGSAIDDNSYQLDGTDVTDAFFGQALASPNTDAIEEIEILSLGAPAEYGSVQGAVFNVVTKQGSNTFHGDANFYYQNDSLTDRNTTDEDDNGFPFYRDSSPEFTGQVGGPIKQDKVWFFGSFQYQKDAFAPVGVEPGVGTQVDERRRFLGKVNVQVNP
ncbi:MAG TPA: carboxypeptidase regulatory-like domain-containing protein, partial [Vicinamibacteria bacterium]|nr:carboxypeptidase regulatory-like domain-containing protein [Vicinamibacteria bacterium]